MDWNFDWNIKQAGKEIDKMDYADYIPEVPVNLT